MLRDEEEFKEFLRGLSTEHLRQHASLYARNRRLEELKYCIDEMMRRLENER